MLAIVIYSCYTVVAIYGKWCRIQNKPQNSMLALKRGLRAQFPHHFPCIPNFYTQAVANLGLCKLYRTQSSYITSMLCEHRGLGLKRINTSCIIWILPSERRWGWALLPWEYATEKYFKFSASRRSTPGHVHKFPITASKADTMEAYPTTL